MWRTWRRRCARWGPSRREPVNYDATHALHGLHCRKHAPMSRRGVPARGLADTRRGPASPRQTGPPSSSRARVVGVRMLTSMPTTSTVRGATGRCGGTRIGHTAGLLASMLHPPSPGPPSDCSDLTQYRVPTKQPARLGRQLRGSAGHSELQRPCAVAPRRSCRAAGVSTVAMAAVPPKKILMMGASRMRRSFPCSARAPEPAHLWDLHVQAAHASSASTWPASW